MDTNGIKSILIVGGGTAGLACANRLLQLLGDDPELLESLGEVPVAIVEKAKTCGGHNLSGAVMRPEPLQELFPDMSREDWRKERFAFGEVKKEAVYLLPSGKAKLRIPTPPNFKNHGNEVISVAADILDRLGILERCVLKINSLGDPECRAVYRKVLVDYYSAHIGKLSEDSKSRLQRNPLRILDSKDEGDKAINTGAPSFADHLNQASRDFFAAVKDGLSAAGIAFEVDPIGGITVRFE